MSLPVRVTAEAEADVLDAAQWYTDRSVRAGIEFVLQVRATLDRIAENPELYAALHFDLRRARVRRYPYGVFFRVRGQAVEVVAVMHDRRDPSVWQNRT
jgi:plasmid stabilization system protein ParE